MPIDKSDLYQKTLPEEDGKDTNLDVLLNYAKDEIKLDYTNLCAGPNGLPRRSGGIERALLSERGDAPIFVVRHHHHLLFVPPLTFHPHTIILLLSVVAGVRGHDEEERCDNHLERGEARGVVRPIRYAAGCRPAGDDELKRVAYWHVSVRIVSNTHCFRSEARSSAYTLFSGTTTPALRPKFVFGDDIADKTAARKVIYSLFPGVDVYRVWIKSAFKLSASTQQMALLVETRARRVQEGSSGW